MLKVLCRALVLCSCALLGCSDDQIVASTVNETMMATSATTSTGTGTGTTEPATSATMTESGGPSTSSSSSSDSSGETSTGTSTTGVTSTATTDSGTTSATDTDTDTDTGTTSDTDGPEDAEYAARFVAGGLDRVFIRKAEKISALCTQVALVWPAFDDEPYIIMTPEGWGVEHVTIAEGLTGCLEFQPLDPPAVAANAGAGTVTWPDQGLCPPTLSINITLEFTAGDLLWVPTKDQLSALDLPVENCP